MDLGRVLTDTLRSIALFLPKALAFLAILVVGWLVARAARMLTDRILERVGFDRLAQRGGVAAWLARGRYDASDLVGKLVYYAVLLFSVQLAFGIWGPNPVSTLINGVVAWLPQAFVAILIVVVAAAIASWVKDIVANALSGLSYGRTLATITSTVIVALGVIAALNQVGVATTVTTPILVTVLATVAGILIVGVGGGLIRPMQSRWESWLDRAGEESGRVAEHARAYSAGQNDARTVILPRSPSAAEQAPRRQADDTAGPAAPAFIEQVMSTDRDDPAQRREAPAVDDATQPLPTADPGSRPRR
ncbi:mechanosensitive ion channel family protein [Catellatospora tritici]|uniref:mechanosensitive ion channel family protein n=1 Tax=Catellatospora tritici TaxID=2851566 RepID=UPI001C2D780A|nr:hypothetical protein [Catellatospora tritici]MBV1856040.1 hypothetical protein [Catellatospora tritici]